VEGVSNYEACKVDIIICIHNALEEVKDCLQSVLINTNIPYSLILVNDGSSEETTKYLERFSENKKVTLITNIKAKGYTFAANQGLQKSTSNYVVLLNSDTEVTSHWLERMMICAESDSQIGIVGPLSNTASWQSIPALSENGDWAENRLPEGLTLAEMGHIIYEKSFKYYPRLPFINGFCLLIKRSVINDIGYFDEDNFGKGYGEEDDYCSRAKDRGWQLAVADDVYVYHKQSRSYSNARRQKLTKNARNQLIKKYGEDYLQESVQKCLHNNYLSHIRNWFKLVIDQKIIYQKVQNRWKGKKITFIVSESDLDETIKNIIQEADMMKKMGLDVTILTLKENQKELEKYCKKNHFTLQIMNRANQNVLTKSDKIIATSVDALKWLSDHIQDQLNITCYILKFEPLYYSKGSSEYKEALKTYQNFDGVFFTKSKINQTLFKTYVGKSCSLISSSVAISAKQQKIPVNTITPELNIAVISSNDNISIQQKVITNISKSYPSKINWFILQENKFPTKKIDIWIDLSKYQPIGLNALEAMSKGALPVLPKNGVGKDFIKHERNGLLVDTRSYLECFNAIKSVIDDSEKRLLMQQNALISSNLYSMEYAVFEIIKVVFL